MLTDTLVSIIIPCFNCETTIQRCLDSILNNTYKKIEIICVNDGSVDKTLQYLEQYKNDYRNIVVINQHNHGQGFARNVGINVSNGEFVVFVDSDDYCDSLFIEEMVKTIDGYDVGICNYFVNDNNLITENRLPIKPGPISIEEFWHLNVYHSVFTIVPWNKIYRRELLMRVKFREDVCYEDEFFATSVFSLIDIKIKYIDKPLYYYYINPNGTMKKSTLHQKIDIVETLIDRCYFFVRNNWSELYNRNARDTLYLILYLKDNCLSANFDEGYVSKINLMTKNVRLLTDYSFKLKIHNCWDLFLFSKAHSLFSVTYFFRKCLRKIIKRG